MPAPKPLRDNPHGDAFNDLEDDGRRFAVIHHGVGPHAAGFVGSAKDFGPGAQLPRLVGLGAIRELSPSEAEEHEKSKADAPAPGEAAKTPVVRPDGAGAETPAGAVTKPGDKAKP
jgi:hypothetical protein